VRDDVGQAQCRLERLASAEADADLHERRRPQDSQGEARHLVDVQIAVPLVVDQLTGKGWREHIDNELEIASPVGDGPVEPVASLGA
jgi:hypothetical protein